MRLVQNQRPAENVWKEFETEVIDINNSNFELVNKRIRVMTGSMTSKAIFFGVSQAEWFEYSSTKQKISVAKTAVKNCENPARKIDPQEVFREKTAIVIAQPANAIPKSSKFVDPGAALRR